MINPRRLVSRLMTQVAVQIKILNLIEGLQYFLGGVILQQTALYIQNSTASVLRFSEKFVFTNMTTDRPNIVETATAILYSLYGTCFPMVSMLIMTRLRRKLVRQMTQNCFIVINTLARHRNAHFAIFIHMKYIQLLERVSSRGGAGKVGFICALVGFNVNNPYLFNIVVRQARSFFSGLSFQTSFVIKCQNGHLVKFIKKFTLYIHFDDVIFLIWRMNIMRLGYH